MSEWDAWIGREAKQTDLLGARLTRQWQTTFDLPPLEAAVLPQGLHFCLCPPEVPTWALGDDGHPARSDDHPVSLAPAPLPRRMWAGSSIRFYRPLKPGDWIERTSRVAAITEKDGRSGKLVFVEISHAISAGGAPAVEERQALVYREAAPAGAPLSPPEAGGEPFDPAGWDAHRVITPDARLLFRYSALTFNTHRIHYDLLYARDIERYRGLVVHGPLIASLLLQLAGAQFGDNRLASFSFRGLSPAIADEPLHLVMRGGGDCLQMAAFAGDGRPVTGAEAVLR